MDNEIQTIKTEPTLVPIGDWLHSSFFHLMRQWAVWLLAQGIMFAFTILAFIVLFALLMMSGAGEFVRQIYNGSNAGGSTLVEWVGTYAVHFSVSFIFVMVFMSLVQTWGSVAMTIGFSYGGEKMAPVGATFSEAINLTLKAYLLTFVLALLCVGTVVLLFIPLFFIVPALFAAWYIVVLEKRGVMEAIFISWSRTRGHRLEIVGRFMLVMLIMFGLMAVLSAATMMPLGGFITLPFQLLLQLSMTAMMIALGYTMYLDLRPTDITQEIVKAPRVVLALFIFIGAAAFVIFFGFGIGKIGALLSKTIPHMNSI